VGSRTAMLHNIKLRRPNGFVDSSVKLSKNVAESVVGASFGNDLFQPATYLSSCLIASYGAEIGLLTRMGFCYRSDSRFHT
jgi:hypothetical protein